MIVVLLALQLAAETPLADPAKEARAEGLMREIRCVVCENEPVSQSTADIAVDMRRSIRTQIDQGSTDEQVRTFFIDRYGQKVSFRPPTEGGWALLWLFPFLLLLGVGGMMGARMFARRRRDLAPLPDDRSGDTGA